jgi:glycogen debranching enzyme
MQITINDDATFLTCNELGDVPDGLELGLYHQDTRFLSRYELLLDGQRPLLLAARATDYRAATHFLTNPAVPGTRRGQITIMRRRIVGMDLRELLEVTNHDDRPNEITLDLFFDVDFAHVFEVKSNIEFRQGPLRRRGDFVRTLSPDGCQLYFHNERNGLGRATLISLSIAPDMVGEECRYHLFLAPRETWRLEMALTITPNHPITEAETRGQSAGWLEPAVPMVTTSAGVDVLVRAPTILTDDYVLTEGYEQSVRDYAALRLESETNGQGEFVIAAGIPWFMTLFGRDSAIAAWQALPLFPEAAKGVLRALARFQGTKVDHVRGEEPGKIMHEYRAGAGSGALRVLSMFPYYGSVDSTPLFLMLLAGVHRVTGDMAFARTLHEPAMRALDWLEQYGDRDGDGYLEYLRENEAGLLNQGWKDSWDAIRFSDGRLAQGPIALCEAQGYAYAARMGMAEICTALGDREMAAYLLRQATALKERFNRDFWLPERGYYALALDGDKRAVDAITSNPGHLLWTGIADEDKAPLVAERLLSPELFSGWGIRSMATTEGGYNPISYHCGSIWPHDTSLIVAGLARYGFIDAAAKAAGGLLAALRFYPDSRFPELFSGYSTVDAPFPVDYPTANRPQAWASGSIFLLTLLMAGINVAQPGVRGRPFLPEPITRLRLEGLWLDRVRSIVDVRRTARGTLTQHTHRLPQQGGRWPWSPRRLASVVRIRTGRRV